MACAVGKTAFAATLLRLGVKRWIPELLWVTIVRINVFHFLISITMFVCCEDPRTL